MLLLLLPSTLPVSATLSLFTVAVLFLNARANCPHRRRQVADTQTVPPTDEPSSPLCAAPSSSASCSPPLKITFVFVFLRLAMNKFNYRQQQQLLQRVGHHIHNRSWVFDLQRIKSHCEWSEIRHKKLSRAVKLGKFLNSRDKAILIEWRNWKKITAAKEVLEI